MMMTRITVRGTGKCHPALVDENGYVMLACSCPGANSGRMKNRTRKIANGWECANCNNLPPKLIQERSAA